MHNVRWQPTSIISTRDILYVELPVNVVFCPLVCPISSVGQPFCTPYNIIDEFPFFSFIREETILYVIYVLNVSTLNNPSQLITLPFRLQPSYVISVGLFLSF